MPSTPNSERLVLIFAYHYPPENAIGAARPFRFAKYLSRLGYTCRVFTAADQADRKDPNTVYVPDPFVVQPRHSLSWQSERAIRKLFLPGDLGMLWSYHASRAAQACIQAHAGAHITIFSTFPPLGGHLAGLLVAERNKLPWIADCRDPLADESAERYRSFFQNRAYRWLERVVAKKANAIIANTDGAIVNWRKRFPSLNGKVHLIWNGFDPEERVCPLPISSGGPRVLCHTGELYDGRSATPILESIARLIARGRLAAGDVRVRLIGPAEAEALPNQEFLDRARVAGWLELVTQRIPQQEALHIAQTSESLLLLQPQSSTQVPGKLFEYLQIGRPILAFVQPNSPSERLLERSRVAYRCVHPGSALNEIDEAVASFFELPSTPVAPGAWFEEHFKAESQTRVLDSLIRQVHSKLKSPVHSTAGRVKQVGLSG